MKKITSILLSGLMLILSACEKDTESSNFAPVVTTGSASNIYRMGATLSGSITLTETNTAKEYGILVSSFESMAEATEYPVKDGSSNFSVQIQNLEPGETYYYCAYASSGYSIAKSQIKSFTTTNSNAPVFNEVILQSKDEKSCMVSVEILDEGGSELLISGFVLGESGKGDPTATNNIKIQNVEPQGSKISATFSGLEPNKTYLVRAYGINASGTGYSNSLSVTTNTATVPFMGDVLCIDSTEVSVTLKSSVIDAGLGDVTKYGFCYSSESKEPTTAHLVVETVEGDTDEFTALIENLNPETTYYFRAYAENEKGVGYSNVIEYTTQQVLIQGSEGDVYVDEAGGLSKFIDDSNKYNITNLKVSGYLNGDDIRLIRDMAGRDVNGNETPGRLVDLDISEATIVDGGGAYYEIDVTGDFYYTANNIIGANMFRGTILENFFFPKVTTIEKQAFDGCVGLVKVNVPEGVTAIKDGAFVGCENLVSAYLPESLVTIGEGVFYACSSLNAMDIPNGVTAIGLNAFAKCSSLQNIVIPNGLTSISEGIFGDCTSLKTVSIPESVTSIGPAVFKGCKALNNIVIPKAVTEIQNYTFDQCTSLTEVVLPNNLLTIGDYAFQGCTALPTITIPESVTSIGNNAFSACKALTNIVIPNGITSIANNTFSYCSSLTNVSLPENLTEIGQYAFAACSSLPSITIPLDVVFIDTSAFLNCVSLSEVTCNATTPPTLGSGAFIKIASSATLFVPIDCEDAYKTSDWANYFAIITDGNEYITDYEVTLSSAGTLSSMISEEDKYNILSLKVAGPLNGDDIRFICAMAGRDEYGNETAGNLIDLDISETSIVEGGSWYLKDPVTSVTLFDTTNDAIGHRMFAYTKLENILLPNSVTLIQWGAFQDSPFLKFVSIPDGVTSIEQVAFARCSSLTSITIPDGVTSIGIETFSGCSLLKNVAISSQSALNSIGYYAFKDCSSLTSIYIPDGVILMDYGVFKGCSSLTSVNIPDEVTKIDQLAFEGCSSLTKINIPDGVTSIGSSAFYGCSSLSEVTCNATTPPVLGSDNFVDIASPATLYVPTSCSTAYSESDWAQYFTTIEEK